MKFFARLVNVGLPLFLCASLLVVGCGDKGGSADTPAGKFKEAMIMLSERMMNIADKVETIEDAEAAEPEIAEIMEEVTAILNDLVNKADTMTEAEKKEFDALMNDPELKERSEKVNASMEKLKREHPEASAKLEEIGRRQSEKMGAAIQALMMKMAGKMGSPGAGEMPESLDDSAHVPGDIPADSGVADTAR